MLDGKGINFRKRKTGVLIANGVWIVYRIAKGWLRLNDNKPMYAG